MPRTRLSPCKSQIPQRKTVDNCHTLPADLTLVCLSRLFFVVLARGVACVASGPASGALFGGFGGLARSFYPLFRGSPGVLGSPR
jgi:hypothetical protein